MRLNRAWIKHRWERRHCPHEWAAGDQQGHQACVRADCGVWRWWPVLRRSKRAGRLRDAEGDL